MKVRISLETNVVRQNGGHPTYPSFSCSVMNDKNILVAKEPHVLNYFAE